MYFLGEYLGLALPRLGEEQEGRPQLEGEEDRVEDDSEAAARAAAGGMKPRWVLHSRKLGCCGQIV